MPWKSNFDTITLRITKQNIFDCSSSIRTTINQHLHKQDECCRSFQLSNTHKLVTNDQGKEKVSTET